MVSEIYEEKINKETEEETEKGKKCPYGGKGYKDTQKEVWLSTIVSAGMVQYRDIGRACILLFEHRHFELCSPSEHSYLNLPCVGRLFLRAGSPSKCAKL